MWNQLTFLWNEPTILWNDLTIDWNEMTGYRLLPLSTTSLVYARIEFLYLYFTKVAHHVTRLPYPLCQKNNSRNVIIRMTKPFRRPVVFNARVMKSFARPDAFNERVTKSFERVDVFNERVT